MAVNGAYLFSLSRIIQAKIGCAENNLPYVLRTGDYFALRAEGRDVMAELDRLFFANERAQSVLDDAALRSWDYHERLKNFLLGTEDASSCGLDFMPPDIDGAQDPGSGPGVIGQKQESLLGSKLFWGIGLGLAAVGLFAGWKLSR